MRMNSVHQNKPRESPFSKIETQNTVTSVLRSKMRSWIQQFIFRRIDNDDIPIIQTAFSVFGHFRSHGNDPANSAIAKNMVRRTRFDDGNGFRRSPIDRIVGWIGKKYFNQNL